MSVLRQTTFGLAIVLGMSLGNSALFGQSADPTVSVAGYSMAKPDKNSKYGGSAVMSLPVGTRVFVKVSVKDMTILSVGEEQIPVIADDKGNALSEESPKYLSLKYSSHISEDKKTVTVPISGKKVPPSGTTGLTIKGTLTLNCGSSTKKESVEGELKTDSEFKFAGIDSKVQSISKGFKADSTRITFRASKSFDAIKSIHAVDKDGKQHEGRSSGSGSFGFRDKKTYQQSYEFELKQGDIKKFEVVFFDKVQQVKVPVDLKVGLGFDE